MTERLAAAYPAHIDTLRRRHDAALAASGHDRLIIHSGASRMLFMDDNATPFRANPPFKAWVPLVRHPDCCIVYEPGRKPGLIYYQPTDYWHCVPQPPTGYWTAHFDITVVDSRQAMAAALPAGDAGTVWLGEPYHCPNDRRFAVNPARLVSALDFARARKTDFELHCMREASAIGARAHTAARAAFEGGGSEFDIHMAYCAAARQGDTQLPYPNIIGLNENAATLHYTELQDVYPAERHSMLIDAGASFNGYACDITRTCGNGERFQALIDKVDGLQRTLCASVTPGRSYVDIHLQAHSLVGNVLSDLELVNCSADGAVEQGITSVFFPHGIGHFIGLQVHDVGGHQANPEGATAAPPDSHPFLRLTRTLEPGHVVTIEPGIYMIDQLLGGARDQAFAGDINWSTVEKLRPYGGVRIEDDVVCTDGTPENLTRDAFAAL